MYNRRYTPERISELKDNEIFVFGSNLAEDVIDGKDVMAWCKSHAQIKVMK